MTLTSSNCCSLATADILRLTYTLCFGAFFISDPLTHLMFGFFFFYTYIHT
jgi:hypothetical protein